MITRSPAVLLAGDSTVAVCPALETPRSGWGPHLGAPLNSRVTEGRLAAGRSPIVVPVFNTAKGGATTASHRADGLWDALMAQALAGDVVVIQFGHNDQKYPDLPAHGGYLTNLRRFVSEVQAVGGHPVLCTPVARRHFQGPRVDHSHGNYPEAVRAAGEVSAIPVIDLTTWSTALYERLGPTESTKLFTQMPAGVSKLYPDGIQDNTHFNFTGGRIVADFVAQELTPVVLAAIETHEAH